MGFLDKLKQKRQEKKLLKDKRKQAKLLAKKHAGRKGKIALCLGGGGARGFAHIGAIKAFIEEDIRFDLVVGTSVGSLVGALYADGVSPDLMMAFGDKLNMKDIKKGFFFQPDDSRKVGNILTNIIGDKNIEDLKMPFACVAVDLVNGKQVIFDKGNVSEAVSASCTVPLVFKPLVKGNQHLVDGGLLNNIPADICRMMGADYVITVDVNPTRGGGTTDLGIINVLKATFNIMGVNASYNGLINSDIIIAPDLSKFKSTEKTGYNEMFQLGYESAKAKIDEIKKLIYK